MGKTHDQIDNRNINISNVGICNYKLPFVFINKNKYNCVATFKTGVFLDSKIRGAHLSRIIEMLDKKIGNKQIKIKDIDEILKDMVLIIETNNINMECNFDIVIPMTTPISNKNTFINSSITLFASLNNNEINKALSITANGAMLCPNSKKISDYGAHSQKCNMKVTLFNNIDNVIISEIIKHMMSQFSSEVYGIVKSVDEKIMTEKAYNNPKFSEDLVKDTLISIRKIYSVGKIKVEIENLESIHQHNVYAIGELL